MNHVRLCLVFASLVVTGAFTVVFGSEGGLVPPGFDPERVAVRLDAKRLPDGIHEVQTNSKGWSVLAEVQHRKIVDLKAIGPKGSRSIPFLCAKDARGNVLVVPIRETGFNSSKMGRAVAEKLAAEKELQELFENRGQGTQYKCWDCFKGNVDTKDWGPIFCAPVDCPKGG